MQKNWRSIITRKIGGRSSGAIKRIRSFTRREIPFLNLFNKHCAFETTLATQEVNENKGFHVASTEEEQICSGLFPEVKDKFPTAPIVLDQTESSATSK
jgi:hypothetical protein